MSTNTKTILACATILALFSVDLTGSDWLRFRGPDGSGVVVDATGLPVRWSDDEGLAWKVALPGPGSSSPIVAGTRIFLTCYSGYGVERDGGGDQSALRRHVLCVDAKSGKIAWNTPIESKLPEAAYRGIGIPNHGYASSTPVADSERVYAFFGRTGVVALDHAGRILWRAAVADDPGTHGFGSAASPILVDDLLIVPASVECESLIAYDKKSGEEKWRSPSYGSWWGTPLVVETGGRKELVVNVPDEIWGLNPRNGKLRWYAEAFQARALCASPVAAGGVIYAIGGRDNGSVAVRAGGRGDVTKSHVVWSGRSGSYVPSPVVLDGHIYWVDDRGIVHCVKADSGEAVYRPQRLDGARGVYASLFAADGKLYAVSRREGTWVLDAKPEFKVLAHNTFESDRSDFNASPAVAGGRLLLRSDRFLYAIAGTEATNSN